MNTNSLFSLRKYSLRTTIIFILLSNLMVFFVGEIYLRVLEYNASREATYAAYSPIGSAEFTTYFPMKKWINLNDRGEKIEISIDKFGLRNNSKIYEEKQNPRVLVFGDSYTMAANTHIESNFVSQLNKLLPKYSFINAGIDGNSNYRSIKLLEYLVPLLQPKGIILMVYLGNDLTDHYFELKDFSYNEPKKQNDLAQAERGSLTKNKRNILHLFRTSLKKSRFVLSLYSHTIGKLKHKELFEATFMGFTLKQYLNVPPHYVIDTVNKTTELYIYLKQYCDFHNIPVLIVGIPAKISIFKEFRLLPINQEEYQEWRSTSLSVIRSNSGYSFDLPDKYFNQICKNSNLPYFSLYSLFKTNISANLYSELDTHWNKNGQKYAAILVSDYIKKRGFLVNN